MLGYLLGELDGSSLSVCNAEVVGMDGGLRDADSPELSEG